MAEKNPPRKPLTDRQKEVYDFLITFIREKGYPPTIREVADNFSIYLKGAHDHIKAIEKKGFVRCSSKSRALEIVDDIMDFQANVIHIPLVGEVAAGAPVLAEEMIEDYVTLPVQMVGGDEMFALRVKGDSMVDAGILPKDIVIVRRQNTAKNGEIIVALLEDEATVKRFFKKARQIILQPENSEYKPIICKEVMILGKVTMVIRNYN